MIDGTSIPRDDDIGTGNGDRALTGSRQHADRERVGRLRRDLQTILYLRDVNLPVAPLAQEDHHIRVGRGWLTADGRARDATGVGRAGLGAT